MLLLVLGVASLAFAAFLVSEVATHPARQRAGALRRASDYGRTQTRAVVFGGENFRDRALAPLKTTLARGVLRLSPKATVDTISLKLLAAGLGRRVSPTGYLASKALAAAAGIPVGILLGTALGRGSAPSVALAVLLALIGFLLPDTVITFRTRARKDRIRGELPDALDLLAVSVEAGLGFDGAITKLAEHMEGPLVEEFSLTLSEMRIGASRAEALKKMSERVAVPEVSNFTRSLIQADQLGISLGRILRVQATDTRNRRQAAAEEKAMKAPIKMLFPTVLFIFPSMFIVVLGPAFLNLGQYF